MKQKIIILIFLPIVAFQAFGQLKSGFQAVEAQEMIALSNSFTFTDIFGENREIIPKGYQLSHCSKVECMDNKYEIWTKGKIGVISFRGSTEKTISWVENMYSAMIPATDTLTIDGKKIPYHFANNPKAAVHGGYALAVILLSEGILEQIRELNKRGINQIFLTGHSQGGALATLTRALLENLPTGALASKNTYKSYAFANPMCGNQAFAEEFNAQFSEKGSAFSIINPEDLVPYMPMSYDDGSLLSAQKVVDWITGKEKFSAKRQAQNAFFKVFGTGVSTHVMASNTLLNELISLKLGRIEMPPFVDDINFFKAGNLKELSPFPYPEIKLSQSEITEENEGDYEVREDGYWYKKEPAFFQHNPYNYYVGTMRAFDPLAYEKLKLKYLEANL